MARSPRVELEEASILHEDEWVLAVDKPSGLPTHATRDPTRDHLLASVARLLGRRGLEAAELFAVHRLDVGTSGVVLLARRPEANAPLSRAFAQREVDKRYDAVVFAGDEEIPPSFEVRRYLRAKGRRALVVRSGGKPSHTVFERIGAKGDRCLLSAHPTTGRMHQIRVHLADRGTPILGDHLYGHRRAHAERLMLHARSLSLPHPSGRGTLEIVAPTPAVFREVLADRQR
jgi:RluA family pseudouridine synthase